MHPSSYTSLKIIHDQKIQEALEQQRLYAGQEMQRQGLLQKFGKFLARFTNQSGRKQEGSLPEWSVARYRSARTGICPANTLHHAKNGHMCGNGNVFCEQ